MLRPMGSTIGFAKGFSIHWVSRTPIRMDEYFRYRSYPDHRALFSSITRVQEVLYLLMGLTVSVTKFQIKCCFRLGLPLYRQKAIG